MSETIGFKPNERTLNIINLMLEIFDIAQQAGKKVVISSGLGLEIEAASRRKDNSLTRHHGDLDIHPMEEDIPFWKEWFERKGYSLYSIKGSDEVKDDDRAFVAYPPTYKKDRETGIESFYVDVYGIMVDENGYIHSRETGEDDNWDVKYEEAFVDCEWRGRRITVMRHQIALHNKRRYARNQGTSLRDKDLHDHELFGINPNDKP
jgi:hypothetical protein